MSQSRTELAPGETRRKEGTFFILCYISVFCQQSWWYAMTNRIYHKRCLYMCNYCHDNGNVYGNGTCELQGTANPPHPWGDMLFYLLQITSATRFHWRKWILFDLLWTFWNLNLRVGLCHSLYVTEKWCTDMLREMLKFTQNRRVFNCICP